MRKVLAVGCMRANMEVFKETMHTEKHGMLVRTCVVLRLRTLERCFRPACQRIIWLDREHIADDIFFTAAG